MFVYSVRATTIKFFGVVCVALATLITVIAFVPDYVAGTGDVQVGAESGDETVQVISYEKVKTAEDAAKFLSQFGWEVNLSDVEEVDVTLPSSFDKILTAYNELQMRQGLNLSKYKNKAVVRYTFNVTNYPGVDGPVLANVLVYRNRVIGGDICSADITGFVTGFDGKQ
ncbi:MAG: DUF4830 domain-containing protein [Clostridia bacterium]|nr:DUF4830 domain-containing protein [Clostridia bacterium]